MPDLSKRKIILEHHCRRPDCCTYYEKNVLIHFKCKQRTQLHTKYVVKNIRASDTMQNDSYLIPQNLSKSIK